MLKIRPIIAHISLKELAILDELQGGRTLDNKTKMPEYFKLGALLQRYPDIAEEIALRFHHMSGDNSHAPHLTGHLKAMAAKGIHGDKTLAIMPANLAKVLDHIVGGPHINPKTGLRQYFLNFLLPLIAEPLIGLFTGAYKPRPGQIVRGHGQYLVGAEKAKARRDAEEKQLAALQAKHQQRLDRMAAKEAGLNPPVESAAPVNTQPITPPSQGNSYMNYQGNSYEPNTDSYDPGTESAYGNQQQSFYPDDEI